MNLDATSVSSNELAAAREQNPAPRPATDLRSAAQIVGLLRGQIWELLDRTLEVIESAYTTPEWLQYGRSERTDETLEMLVAAVRPRLPRVRAAHPETERKELIL
jgi:hypothetical protein